MADILGGFIYSIFEVADQITSIEKSFKKSFLLD